MPLSISRRRVVVAAAAAAIAALCLSLSLATPALAMGIEQEGEGVEAGGSSPQQLDVTVDWKGLRRDTLYFLGYQAVAIAVLYPLPESVTGWDKDTAGFSKWWDNVTNPHRDTDDAYLNWITHPYWGASYYIRGRERGLNRWQSFGYSALLSTLYEYGAEAFFEKPSYQDLWITPVIGSLLGEFVFSPLRESIRAKPGGPDGMDQFLLVLTDPLGAANELTDRLFGAETHVSFVPMGTTRLSVSPTGPLATSISPGSRVAWPHTDSGHLRGVTWGLKLEVRW